MKTVAIIQARMASTRLPGKVLMDIADKPMLARVVARISRASNVNEVVVATSDADDDEPIVAWCREARVPCERGPQEDVLARFRLAADAREADVIVRVGGDSPLVDPQLADDVIALLQRTPMADYASNSVPPLSHPVGLAVEALTKQALDSADNNAAASREHVTPSIYCNPDRFAVRHLRPPPCGAGLRWTVDTPEDLQVVRAIYRHFGHDRFTWLEALQASQEHPEWATLNAHIQQRSLTD